MPDTEATVTIRRRRSVAWHIVAVMLVSLSACEDPDRAPDTLAVASGTSHEEEPSADPIAAQTVSTGRGTGESAAVPARAAETRAPASGWVPPRSVQVGDTRCTLNSQGHLGCGHDTGALLLRGVVEVAADDDELCARTTDGSAFCGAAGALTRIGGAVGVRQLAVARAHACFLGNDRRVRCRAPGRPVRRVARLEGAVEIAANNTHFFARTRDGHVAHWPVQGPDGRQARALDPPVSDARAIAARGAHFCVVRGAASTVWCSDDAHVRQGDSSRGLQAIGLEGANALGAMVGGACALVQDASLFCWGRVSGTGVPTAPSDAGTVPSGGYLRCGAQHCCVAAPAAPTACVGQLPGSPPVTTAAMGWALTERSFNEPPSAL